MAIVFKPGAHFKVFAGEIEYTLKQPTCYECAELADKLDQMQQSGRGGQAVRSIVDSVAPWVVLEDGKKLGDVASIAEVRILLSALISGGITEQDRSK